MSVRSMTYWNLVSVKVGKLCVEVYEAWLHTLLNFEALTNASESIDVDQEFDLARVSSLTGQLNESESILEKLIFLNDESVNFNQTFCEHLELSSFEGLFSMHGLSSVALRDVDVSHGPIAALYAQLVSISQSSLLPDVNDHSVNLPALQKEDLTLVSSGGGVRGVLWKHYKHILLGAMMRMLVSHAVWMLDNVGESQKHLLRKQSEDAKEASEQVDGLGQGLQKGFENFGDNLLEGLTGAITKPLDGASSGGLVGFFQGVGAGALGMVSKPILAVAEFGQILGDALDTDVQRIRRPRAVYYDRILRKYTSSHALAMNHLKQEEAALRQHGKQRLADAVRRNRRGFVCFCTAGGGGQEGGVLVADGKIMVVGTELSEVIQQVAFKDVRLARVTPAPHFVLEVVTVSNTTLSVSAAACDESERSDLIECILACVDKSKPIPPAAAGGAAAAGPGGGAGE